MFDRGIINPFHQVAGKTLPWGWFWNYQGLLVKGATSFALDPDLQTIVAQGIPFPADYVVIACLIEGEFYKQSLIA